MRVVLQSSRFIDFVWEIQCRYRNAKIKLWMWKWTSLNSTRRCFCVLCVIWAQFVAVLGECWFGVVRGVVSPHKRRKVGDSDERVPQIVLVSQSNAENRHRNTIFIKPHNFHILFSLHGDCTVILVWENSRNIQSAIGDLPVPQGLLLVQNGGRRNPWLRLPKWLQKFVRISTHIHDEMSSFCLNNGFRLQKTIRAARRWKQPPKKLFHLVSHDKILHDSWSISVALARGFSDPIFWKRRRPWGRGWFSRSSNCILHFHSSIETTAHASAESSDYILHFHWSIQTTSHACANMTTDCLPTVSTPKA